MVFTKDHITFPQNKNMFRLSPYFRYLISSFGGLRSKHWREVAIKDWELAPAVIRENHVPICIDGQLEKTKSMDHEWRIENPTNLFFPTRMHKATTAHLLKDVELIGTSLFSRRMFHWLSNQKPCIFDRGVIENVSSAVLASGYSGNIFFGHFIGDTIPLCLMASDVAKVRNAEIVSPPLINDGIGHRNHYLEILGVKPRFLSRAHFDELVIIDPLGLNNYHCEKMVEFRRRIREHVRCSIGNHKVYLSRGTLGSPRSPINEVEVESVFLEYGYHILKPEQMSLDDLLASMLDAKVIAGVEGSQLRHAIPTAGKGATLMVLQPPHRFVTSHKIWAEEIGLRWGFLIGHQVGHERGKHYKIDLWELRQTLDLIGR